MAPTKTIQAMLWVSCELGFRVEGLGFGGWESETNDVVMTCWQESL